MAGRIFESLDDAFRISFGQKTDNFTMGFNSTDKSFGAGFGTVTETGDYNKLYNKPRINGIELIGDTGAIHLQLQERMDEVSESDIDEIIYG